MAATWGASLTVCVCVLLLPTVTGLQAEDRECAFTEHQQGAEPLSGPAAEMRGVVRDNGTVRCSRGFHCYGLWKKSEDGEIQLVQQGCWSPSENHELCHSDRCLVMPTPPRIRNGNFRFCCCNRDMCNTNFTEAPPTADTPALRPVKAGGRGHRPTDHQPLRREETVLIALVTVTIAAVVIVVLFLGYRVMRGKQKHTLWALDVMEAADSDSVDLDNLKLLELIGRGRYGTVFRGCLHERSVAVKMFSGANRHNYVNERSIYSLPLLQHDNIAHFLSADERTASDGRPEFLILLEYYPHGCLSLYLSVHTVDWATCCRMTHGVSRGLSFLHTELHRGDRYKPAVAHRDVSSRNVLVRSDLSCVLADFGLSMKLTGSSVSRLGDDDTAAISEVGTVRYMAPEVLGGALNLRDCESALKQVDMYALGLLLWESFRRCTHLYTGESVPEYQLAFQAELGNHPTLEQMQILVCREKLRPRFSEAWGDGAVVRSLRETMEDCWDQDAEARLTAQCAEERLWDLAQLTTHSLHNLRNLSHGCWPQVGSTSPFIRDLQVSVAKNLQGDSPGPVVVTTNPGAERTRKSINYERQQTQVHSFHSDESTTVAMAPTTVLTGAGVLRPLSQDLDQTEGSCSVLTRQCDPGPSSTHSTPKRPASLHLLPRTKESTSASSHLKLGILKSKHRQVETGVAKMDTVTVASAVEPHLVTTVTNNLMVAVAGGFSAGVPTLVTNSLTSGGRTNPAGPQLEEDQVEAGLRGQEDPPVNLLHPSPDEHEPLLRMEQPVAETDPLPLHHHPRSAPNSSNSNNNNNRTTGGTDTRIQGSEAGPEKIGPGAGGWGRDGPNHPTPEPSQGSDTGPHSNPEEKGLLSRFGQCPPSQTPPSDPDPDQGSGAAHTCLHTAPLPTGCTETRNPVHSMTPPLVSEIINPAPEDKDLDLDPEVVNLDVDPSEVSASESKSRPSETSAPQSPGVLRPRGKRPERPCSLDLSSSDVPLTDSDGLSASGEKIKRRVKTPYTLKKWRPASWVVSTDTALDPDFGFNPSSRSQTQCSSSGLQRAGSFGPKINQSKSSMAVFLVGGGTTATTASEPDGMTCF